MQADASPAAATLQPADRKSEFVPVQGGTETTSAAQLLLIAYVLMWFAVFWFVRASLVRQGRLDARLKTLEQALTRLDQLGTKDEPAASVERV